MAEKDVADATSGLEKFGAAIKKLGPEVSSLAEGAANNIKTFNSLSATGNAFNNDIIGMKVAAANSRMSLDELGAVVTKSGKDFAGLGGSVTKGSQVFTEFSKTFFDSGVTENLRQMGYSSKDLNEVLALQIGAQKSTTDTSVAGQIRTAQSAAALAEEMDLIAKLTGKSRKEQEEQLQAAQRNGQIEAKFRLIGITQGAEAEKAARDNFGKQLAQAQAMGTEAVFKEMFATGTVRSREASMQMGLLGDAARETANSAKSLAKGNVEASQAAMEAAQIGNMQNQKNVALLQITAAGVGEAGAILKKNVETNDAAYHGMVKTQKAAEAMGVELGNTSEALKAQREAIKEEQKARHGITQSMITLQARGQDITAAIGNQVVAPLNKGEVDKSLRALSDNFSNGVRAQDETNKLADQYRQGLRNQARMGGPEQAPLSSRERIEGLMAPVAKPLVKSADNLGAAAVKGIETSIIKTMSFGAEVINVAKFNARIPPEAIPSRDAGTLGKTGQPFEPADILARIHKGEMVLTPEQARSLVTGAKTEGLTAAVNEMARSMPKIDLDKVPGNVDISAEAEIAMKAVNSTLTGRDAAKTATATQPAQAATAASGFQMPSMDQISFGPDGMPRISARPQAQTMAQRVAAERKETPPPPSETNEAAKQGIMANPTAPATQPAPAVGGQAATLNDVVKSLDSLNMFMGKLLNQSETTTNLIERQVKATKAIGGNVYDRMS